MLLCQAPSFRFLWVLCATATFSDFSLVLATLHALPFVASLLCPRLTLSSCVDGGGCLVLICVAPSRHLPRRLVERASQIRVGVLLVAIYDVACRRGLSVVRDPRDSSCSGVTPHRCPLLAPQCHCFDIRLETCVIHSTRVFAAGEQAMEMMVPTLAPEDGLHVHPKRCRPQLHGPGSWIVVEYQDSFPVPEVEHKCAKENVVLPQQLGSARGLAAWIANAFTVASAIPGLICLCLTTHGLLHRLLGLLQSIR